MLLSSERRSSLLGCSLYWYFFLTLAGHSMHEVKAFAVPTCTHLTKRQSLSLPLQKPAVSTKRSPSSHLFLSDIPEQPQEQQKSLEQKQQRKEDWLLEFLPPAPEDELVMMGDLLSLAVYGFADHFLSNSLAQHFTHQLDSPYKLYHATSVIDSQHYYHAPVWLDCTDNAHTVSVLQMTLQDRLVTHYSPALESTGVALCLLMTAWLAAGWWHGAFLLKHTVHCSTRTALWRTLQTWVTCSLLVLGLASLSSTEWTLTPGDLSFVVDSLSVLVLWRFLASWILGTGTDR